MANPAENKLYDDSHAVISGIIGRRYYNSVGEAGFEILGRIISDCNVSRIFDLGSGNGNAAVWFAQHCQVHICGVEPLPVLYQRALKTIEGNGFNDCIKILNTDFYSFTNENREIFDAVLGIDTFCYFPDRAQLFTQIAQLLPHKGLVLFSDLISEQPGHPAARPYLDKYNLSLPLQIQEYKTLLKDLGFKEVRFDVKTEWYRDHWSSINSRVIQHRSEIIEATSQKAFDDYLKSTEVILSAIRDGAMEYVLGAVEKV